MALGLEIEVRRTGRVEVPLAWAVERELTLDDVAALAEARDTKPSVLKRLTDRHHSLARLVAAGMKQNEAALVCGYDPDRVSILKTDPMFKELVEFYRSQEQKQFRDLGARLAGMAADATDAIQERLEDDEQRDKIPLVTLLKIVELGADRTGFGPSATQTNVNVHVDLAGKLEARRKAARETAMRDITPAIAAE